MNIPVAILCGGKGTRLGELTKDIPKSLVKVAGKPFIFWQLDLLADQGFTDVTLCVGHLDNLIKEAVGFSYRGITIKYLHDGGEPLGTMGAMRQAVAYHLKPSQEFMAIYGDSYLDTDYAQIIQHFRSLNGTKYKALRATYDGVDYGITILTGWSLVGMGGLMELNQLPTAELPMPEKWLQIGDPEGLAEVEALLAKKVVPWEGASNFIEDFLKESIAVISSTVWEDIEAILSELVQLRERKGRLFIIGVGGSMANASHAACDFRKLCDIDAYAMDNMAEMTARTNDDGWRNTFTQWLRVSRLSANDCLLVLSVGGGQSQAPATSVNIAYAVQEANRIGTPVLGIVGRDGGYTAQHATCCVIVPTINSCHVTPHTEWAQALIWHLLVSHPSLKINPTKW